MRQEHMSAEEYRLAAKGHGAKVKRDTRKGDAVCDALAAQIVGIGNVVVSRELRFHPTRRWRWDVALPGSKIAVEVEGGLFVKGGHARGVGIMGDMEKMNEAVLLGWRVLRVTHKQVHDGTALALVKRALLGYGSDVPESRASGEE